MSKILTLCLALLLSQPAGAATAQEQQPRDMSAYAEASPIFLTWGVPSDEHERLIEQARSFLWSNWQQKRRAHVSIKDCTIYPEGCDDHKTYDFYVEPDERGRWRIQLETEHTVLDRPAEGRRAETTRRQDVYFPVERVEAGAEAPCWPIFREPPTVRPGTHRLRLNYSYKDGKGRDVNSCRLF